MGDTIQNIRIKFVKEGTGVIDATKELQGLTKAEQDAVRSFKALNDQGIAANKAIQAEAKKTTAETEKTSKSTKALSSTFSGLGATIIAAFSVTAILGFGKQVIDITAQFEKLRAVLTNTLGSESLADSALNKIKNLAATTNFGVLELTNAYVKLANSGFEPTTKDLLALADLTNSTGKTFDQLAEAILDANTDQFIRLKEFGIKASREGDKISFLFKGVRTEVDRNSASITKYLISLGQIPGVMGATAAISQTVTGKISNLGDAYDFLLNTIGSQQSGFFKGAIQGLTDFTNFLNSTLRSVEQFNEKLVDNASLHKQNQLNGYLKEERALIGDNTEAIVAFNKAKAAEFSEAKISNEESLQALQQQVVLLQQRREEVAKGVKKDFFGNYLSENSDAIKAFDQDIKQVQEQIILTSGTIKAQEQIVHDLENENKQIGIAEQERLRLQQEAYEKGKARREKAFNDAKGELDQAEANAIRRANLEGQTEASIIGIHQEFNTKREELFKQHNKNRGADFEGLILHEEELEQSLTNLTKAELEKRLVLDKTIQAERLANIESSLAAQALKESQAQNQLIEIEKHRYASGEIDRKQYEENIEAISVDSERKQLQNQITADQEKLLVSGQTSEQIVAIETDLENAKKELLDLEFSEFEKTEKKKVDAAKERTKQIKMLEKQAFDSAVSIIDSLFQIGQNNRDSELQELEIQKKQELAQAGESKEKQDAINRKYAEKEKALKIEQAKADKNQALFNAGLHIAEGVLSALTVAPPLGFVLAALVAAAGAVQLAAIQSKPLPKFFGGTEYAQLNGNPRGRDTIPAMIHEGERIVPTAINEHLKGIPNSELPRLAGIYRGLDYKGIANAINGSSGGHQDKALLSEMKSIKKELSRLKVANISFDKNGFNTYLETKNSKTELVNNYFRN